MMTVRKLIKELGKLDPKRIVVMSRDAEGNGFSPLADVATGAYTPDTTWSGEVHLEELTDELREQGYTEEDVREDGQKAVVLWPTN